VIDISIASSKQSYAPPKPNINNGVSGSRNAQSGRRLFLRPCLDLRLLNERLELWSILEDGSRRSKLERYVEITAADRERHDCQNE
jgi:hypothetical protein